MWIANLIRVKARDAYVHTVFHFACAKIMQERPPLLVFFQIFGHMLGQKNVPGVTAIHHPLRHVQAGSG